eukprot:CAMPEP_0195145520 /NCGR_PEP_ID=MMETSP0448-20130528/169979_1 /TAXON_ID=66468 /ORGANISM="Heterocapsa triquestra, Strain CCMP 448" /LENGTH=71 /DNA_ID=CAMNT_0040184035 /DNA_START=169 /DNA_END=381 /DNA_ORIENTATION=-
MSPQEFSDARKKVRPRRTRLRFVVSGEYNKSLAQGFGVIPGHRVCRCASGEECTRLAVGLRGHCTHLWAAV